MIPHISRLVRLARPLTSSRLAAIGIAFCIGSQAAKAELVITEIMAVADLAYPDEDGAPSDWIEITNTGGAPASLAGHYLTNSAIERTRWAFPAVNVPAGGIIVVFASGKNRAVAGSELHASFTLDRGGDYVGLIGPDGSTPVSEFAPGYPQQYDGISYGLGVSGSVSREAMVSRSATVRYHIATDDSLGTSWRQAPASFDDAAWASAAGPVGYESGTVGNLWNLINTDIAGPMKGTNASGFFRFPFSYDSTDKALVAMTLKVWIDDGFAAFLNGVEVGTYRAPNPLLWNSQALSSPSRSDATVVSEPIEFDLSTSGGALVDGANVLAIQGMNTGASGSDFVVDAELIADVADTSAGIALGYFEQPTPGLPNDTNRSAPPADIEFSVTSFVFTDDFVLSLSCATPGAVIRYTTDLSVPVNELGAESIQYTAPIAINGSTQIRARAFLPGSLDGATRTETFLKMDANAAAFSSNLPVVVMSTLGGGAPFESGSTQRRTAYMFIFEPDPATGRTTLDQPPTLTTRAGIRKRGSSSSGWPKYGMSVETWNDGDDLDRNIEPLGLDREGDWILNSRWRFDLSLMRNPFIYEMSRQIGRYAARSRFVELFNDVDGGTSILDDDPGNRGARDYFGVYSFMERLEADPNRIDVARIQPWENSEPEITGGYVWKKDRADPGEPGFSGGGMGGLVHVDPDGLQISAPQKAYISGHLAAVDVALSQPNGINPSTGIHFTDYVDADSWIDHIMLNTLAMNVDWGRLSAYLHKDRNGKVVAGPIWDFDRNMGSEDGRDDNPRQWDGPPDSSKNLFDNRYPYFGKFLGFQSQLNSAQLQNPAAFSTRPDMFQKFIDRWAAFRDGGPFATDNMLAVIDGMAAEIEEAAARSFVRWPENLNANDNTFSTPPRLAGWEGEVSQLRGWMTARAEWIDDQFLERPSFNHPGGVVPDGFALVMTSPDGSIYFTLDGSDPRAAGGGIAASAIPFQGGPVDTPLLGEGVAFTYFVPPDDSLGLTWAATSFDDAAWSAGVGGAGWETTGSTLEPAVDTDIRAAMQGTNPGGYFRYEFEFTNTTNVNSMSLDMLIDDGFVAYLNGVEVASLKAPASPQYNSTAVSTPSRSDTTVLGGYPVDISAHTGALVDGTNVLAIHAMNSSISGSDFLVRPDLTINHTVSSEAVELQGAVVVTARVLEGGVWSAPTQVGYIAGSIPADTSNLVVSEVMYRPTPPSVDELSEGYDDRDLFEYIELLNTGDAPVALLGSGFVTGVIFDFNTGGISLLDPGERVLVVRNLDAFSARYGAEAAARVAGEFANDTGLSNDGEQIVLSGVGGTIRDFTYNDQAPWPVAADGDGFSLVLIDPEANPDHAIAANWQSSAAIGGTPGDEDGQSFAEWAAANGNVTAGSDDDSDGRDAVIEFAQGTDPNLADSDPVYEAAVITAVVDNIADEYLSLTFQKSLTADGAGLVPEVSDQLASWAGAGGAFVLVEEINNGDGTAQVTYRSALPFDQLPADQFVRLRATLE